MTPHDKARAELASHELPPGEFSAWLNKVVEFFFQEEHRDEIRYVLASLSAAQMAEHSKLITSDATDRDAAYFQSGFALAMKIAGFLPVDDEAWIERKGVEVAIGMWATMRAQLREKK